MDQSNKINLIELINIEKKGKGKFLRGIALEIIFKVETSEHCVSSLYIDIFLLKKDLSKILTKKTVNIQHCLFKLVEKTLLNKFIIQLDSNVKDRELILMLKLKRQGNEILFNELDSKTFTLVSKYV